MMRYSSVPRIRSSLGQEMACCLTEQAITWITKFCTIHLGIILHELKRSRYQLINGFKDYTFETTATCSRGQWVIITITKQNNTMSLFMDCTVIIEHTIRHLFLAVTAVIWMIQFILDKLIHHNILSPDCLTHHSSSTTPWLILGRFFCKWKMSPNLLNSNNPGKCSTWNPPRTVNPL